MPAGDLASLGALSRLPFTAAADVRKRGGEFLAVSQDEIGRAVTAPTSGTTGAAKRIFFTAADQEATGGFFRAGLLTFAGREDRVLLLFPGERPGSVNDLLRKELNGLGIPAFTRGDAADLAGVAALMDRENITVLAGVPGQLLALAKYCRLAGPVVKLSAVLLSADCAAAAVRREIEAVWDARVFEHYGMTEMGFGGAMQCSARRGYHLREADLYFEIVDPDTGEPRTAGEEGEVVFTTLTQQGMPLIRYRTGDLARFLGEPCPCGSVLKRIDLITGRVGGAARLPGGGVLTVIDLDDALLSLDAVVDYNAVFIAGEPAARLTVDLKLLGRSSAAVDARLALGRIPAIAAAAGRLVVEVGASMADRLWPVAYAKRTITLKGDGDER